MTMYRAVIAPNSSFQARSDAAYNFGTGDFTVMAMVSSTKGGTVVARKGSPGGSGNGGFLLVINPNGTIKFATDSGFGYYQVVSAATNVLNGDCHTVCGIRTGAKLSIVVDGVAVAVTASGNASPPLNVNNSLPLTIGTVQQTQEPYRQFVGAIMNVSLWGRALAGDDLVKAAFARVTGTEPGLRGYWRLNKDTNDLSNNHISLTPSGSVSYEFCLACVWTQSVNSFVFCHMANMASGGAPPANVSATQRHSVTVPSGAPAFCVAIMAAQDTPAFPNGAKVKVTDPGGKTYSRDENTDSVYAKTVGGELWALMIAKPVAGTWTVTVTAPATLDFNIFIQTVPSASVVATSEQALQPLYGTESTKLYAAADPSARSFWSVLKTVAVSAIAGAMVTGAVLVSGGTLLPALAAGVVAFGGVSLYQASDAVSNIDTASLETATHQVVGMAGFTIAADTYLLFDANVTSDPATELAYKRRKKKLYPAVTLSTFNKVQTDLTGPEVSRTRIKAALSSTSAGYVSGCGHGLPTYLCGWYVQGNDGPLEEILKAAGAGKFDPAEAKGKIFHFLACNCGAMGSDQSPGLGRALVAGGAIAFFGYSQPFVISKNDYLSFIDSDMQIDFSLMAGKTCDVAYTETIAVFNQNIARLEADGNVKAAAQLRSNRDSLVAPSTNAVYGNREARLQIAS